MNTPNWMIAAPADAPRRAKVRHGRRSTDRRGLTVDVVLAFAAMVAAMAGIYELNSLMLH